MTLPLTIWDSATCGCTCPADSAEFAGLSVKVAETKCKEKGGEFGAGCKCEVTCPGNKHINLFTKKKECEDQGMEFDTKDCDCVCKEVEDIEHAGSEPLTVTKAKQMCAGQGEAGSLKLLVSPKGTCSCACNGHYDTGKFISIAKEGCDKKTGPTTFNPQTCACKKSTTYCWDTEENPWCCPPF
jgi:hypothetical protein